MSDINMSETLTVEDMIDIAANMRKCEFQYRDAYKPATATRYYEYQYFIESILNDYFHYSFDDLDSAIDTKYEELKKAND